MADYSLAALEVEGFRGFNSKQKFPIDSRLTLVSGNNGVGKSSLLGSVEWCLYGDLNFIKYMDSKVRDELVNQSHPRGVATVTLSLRKGPDSYRIERSKELGTRTTHLALKSPSGQFEDELAEQEVYKLFGLTSDRFHSRGLPSSGVGQRLTHRRPNGTRRSARTTFWGRSPASEPRRRDSD